ncbi:hypothetical protein [Polynucleobacter sp. 80A-SIGWE]|uniref:hypothetical protein n=1 Tax=Polynucleobacter sp. 80A-SIGWE TaxID=2689100 RepID=UPI001C0A9757|nr:hypothetical protein [Polynucleobacter sp. 80A-SIGWE]MBU3588516.1 hypothetical protein [Polynucleobacter sp. 80A-SIGWE]
MATQSALKNPKRERLIFSTRSYPTFGRGKSFDESNPPDTVKESPYYWWFMFLRLNEDYKATCKAKGKGKCAAIYKDFGNIYITNFKDWWNTKDGFFSEPRRGYRMAIANNQEELAPFNSEEVLNLVVPLTWSQRSLKKAFSQLVLSKVEKGKKGISVEKSEAQYKISGRWHAEAMATAYKIYTIKKESEAQGIKMIWVDVAIKAKMPMTYALGNKSHKVESSVKRNITILAMRHYRRAEEFIESAATKSFPYSNR